MLVQIITENGQKKIIPLTADAGAGNPVGTIIPMYKKSSPSGYLYCDGSTFDQTKYPLLYAYLGSNVLPDYREFALVGAEENTTDVYNASTNPNGTIHVHDVFTEGEAKDDCTQRVQSGSTDSSIQVWSDGTQISNSPIRQTGRAPYQYPSVVSTASAGIYVGFDFDNARVARTGDVDRGKRKAVYFYIKATSGLSENAQDNVINTLNEQRSYSTEEHWTGKYWIDGKKIYSKTVDCGTLPNNTTKTVNHNISNIDKITDYYGIFNDGNDFVKTPYSATDSRYTINMYVNKSLVSFSTLTSLSIYSGVATIEYTKTTY